MMTTKLLLPNRYKLLGWCLLIPATIAGIVLSCFTGFETGWLKFKVFAILDSPPFSKDTYFNFVEADVTNTTVGVLFIIGALIVSFSREKREDEFIAKLRLSSLLWAVCVNYILLFLAFLFVYGTAFLTVMVYNMFTVLIIFIARFNYILYKNSKIVSE